MAKDPAFLFYTGDFSTGTQFFTDEQVGKYVRLLMAQHQHGHLYEKHMIQICKTHDKDVFGKFKQDSNGLYYNERLENELIKRKDYSKSRSENRKKKNISETYDIHMEIKDISIIISSLNLNGENDLEKKTLAMLVKEMMENWLCYKPTYSVLIQEDYSSLLQIAYIIAEKKGWDKHEILNIKEQKVIESWKKIIEWLTGERQSEYYKTMPLDKICTKKGFRDIEERMKTTPVVSALKATEMEKKRITPEDYFEK